MQLSIIIVSWNTCELILKCVKSIFKYIQNIEWEIFVVDNNSSDNTVKELEKLNYKNLYIIKNKNNLGFAKANNQALRLVLSKAKDPEVKHEDHFILLLNPDTEFIDNSIIKLIDFINSDSKIGIVGPKLLNTDKTLQRSCRRFPKLIDQIFIQLKFYNFFPNKIKAIREYFMLDFDHNEVKEVDQVMGAAMLIKKEVIKKIGLLDEKFWAVFEEVDFCKRAKNAGYKIYFYPNTKIVHHKEQSFKQINNLKKQINFNRSLYYYFRKHKPFWQLVILWIFQPINLLLTFLDSKIGIRKFFGKGKDV
ncbi:glycosyltransferase family 2 protein [Patescibacteria group bacterium]|nr:glycosyltransferase family 2 protein [Patescibacteria group bacterium]